MRILLTIPHFYQPKGHATFRSAPEIPHGSEADKADERVRALSLCLTSLHQVFGTQQSHIINPGLSCNGLIAAELDIVVCTTSGHHLVDRLPKNLFRHHETTAQPRLLGYECHAFLAENLGLFDYYCFLEDDLLIIDPLFFWKLAWFAKGVGDRSLLQPHRFELSTRPPIRKLYIDGPLRDPTISPRFQNTRVRPNLSANVLGMQIGFERVDNPHSGCFFLTAAQMQRWTEQPFFLDRSDDFWGPLESAATLGIMRTFEIYKPVLANAGFLEVRHLDVRYLNKLLKLPPGHSLTVPGSDALLRTKD
jgi:hypothetical protein